MSAYDIEHQHRSWLTKAPLGLLLTGLGTVLISQAARQKYDGAPTGKWVVAGTVALTVFNSGLSVLVDAGKHRGHYERLRDDPTPVPPTPAS